MKKLIAILLTCLLLMTVFFVTGCDKLFPDQGNGGDETGENGNNGDNGGSGGSGTTGDTVDNGDNDNQEVSSLSDFEFELNEGGNSFSVTQYRGSQTNVVIPSSYLGKPVTGIGECVLCDCGSPKSITIPDSVTRIDALFFEEGNNLEVITVAEGNSKYHSSGNCLIETESKTLILGCKNSIIPSDGSVTSIGTYAFNGCISLTSITIPDSVTSIGNYAFFNCIGLTSITIPDSVTSIGYRAFYNCISLESITVAKGNSKYHSSGNCVIETESKTLILGCKNSIIPSDGSVTSIGSSAFEDCSSLTSITIPNSVTSIGSSAFYGCHKLVEVYNLSSLDITAGSNDNGHIGYYALDVYTDINTPSKLWTNSDGYIFYENGDTCYLIGYTGDDTELILPNSCNGKNYAIYKYAFYGCHSLTSVTIPDSVTSIGSYAFLGCSSPTSVHISDIAAWCAISFDGYYSNPLRYAENLYLNGSLVTEVVIPDSVTSIGNYAFSGCSSLTSITIPDSVTSIGWAAFSGCTGLTEIKFNAIAMNDLSSYNHVFSNGKNYAIYKYAFHYCSTLTSITIPDSVTSIGNDAFFYCSKLTSVVIGNNVTGIGSGAFYGCRSLTSITIPDSVTSIGSDAFANCSSLKSITFEDTTTWYCGGEQVDVSDPSTNAKYFTDTYCDYYWYKN